MINNKCAQRYPSTSSGRAQRRTERVFTIELVEVSGRAGKKQDKKL
jgi:hypothetical protein